MGDYPSSDAEFLDVELDRDHHGLILSATGYCPYCESDRLLKVNSFAGGYGLRCLSCGTGQTVHVKPCGRQI